MSDGKTGVHYFRHALSSSLCIYPTRMQFVQSRMVPKFTPRGFEVVKTPPAVAQALKDAVHQGLSDWDNLPYERDVEVIYNAAKQPPKFVHIQSIAERVHRDLLPLHEAWAGGMKLRPTSAYGVRLYQNGSSLVMHYDKVGYWRLVGLVDSEEMIMLGV